MWRVVGPMDFIESNKAVQGDADDWWVCSEYEIREGVISAAHPFDPRQYVEGAFPWRVYKPLKDAPDLFLRFARLYDLGYSEGTVLDWMHDFGPLGVSSGWKGSLRTEAATVAFVEETMGTNGRRDEEPVRAAAFWDEVCWAAGVLAAYEAYLNDDHSAARSLLYEEFGFLEMARIGSEDSRMWWWKLLERDFGKSVAERLEPLFSRRQLQGIKEFTVEEPEVSAQILLRLTGAYLSGEEYDPLLRLMSFAEQTVSGKLRGLCFPRFVHDAENPEDLSEAKAGWGARNLLGAMYLQMYWLMTSTGDLARCGFCGRLIALSRPNPEGRKRRSDKKYCNDACRQAHRRAKKKA